MARRASVIPNWRKQKHGWLVLLWWLLALVTIGGGLRLLITGRGKNPLIAEHIFIWQMIYIVASDAVLFRAAGPGEADLDQHAQAVAGGGSRTLKHLDVLDKA